MYHNIFFSWVNGVPLPPLLEYECQAVEGQGGDGLQQAGHKQGWDPHQGGVCQELHAGETAFIPWRCS